MEAKILRFHVAEVGSAVDDGMPKRPNDGHTFLDECVPFGVGGPLGWRRRR